MGGVTLDAGALIAVDKGDRAITLMLARARAAGEALTIPVIVLAQAWRRNNVCLARLLPLCKPELMDVRHAKRVGELLAVSRTSDVIDAAVVIGAAERGDVVLTSDPGDLEHLAAALGRPLRIVAI
jgi:hypothetical protein